MRDLYRPRRSRILPLTTVTLVSSLAKMRKPPQQPVIRPPGPGGLDCDVPCLQCGYNLRGLIEPHCPECGFQFDWATLPQLIELARLRRRRNTSLINGLILLVIILGVLILLATDVGLLVFGFIFALAVGAVQTLVELGPASLFVGAPTWKRFFAWWEGVLIGFGVCAATILMSGYGTCLFDRRWVPGEKMRFLPLLVLLAAESYVVQCIIVRWRMALFGERVPVRRLLLGCLLAKCITAAILIGQPLRIIGHF